MGCLSSTEILPVRIHSKYTDSSSLSPHSTQASLILPLSHEGGFPDLPDFEADLASSQTACNYSVLLKYLTDYSPETSIHPYPSWASSPTTRNAAVLAVLNAQLIQNKIHLESGALCQVASTIIKILESGSSDAKEHLVFFLFALNHSKPRFIKYLVKQGLFTSLNRLLISPCGEMDYVIVRLCASTVRYYPRSRTYFVAAYGIQFLLAQMLFTRSLKLTELQFDFLQTLLVTPENNLIVPHVSLLLTFTSSSFLQVISKKCNTPSSKQKLDNILHITQLLVS